MTLYLKFQLTLNSNDYLRNSLNIRKFYVNHDFYNLRERINKADWTAYRSPTEVNADNSLLLNTISKLRLHHEALNLRICPFFLGLSAGILQGSFFGKDRPTYLNYATAGWTVGHEITHGFDDIVTDNHFNHIILRSSLFLVYECN